MGAAVISAESPLLQAQGLTKRFPGVTALDGVSFGVEAGEVHAVVQAIGDEIREALPGSRVLVHPDAAGLRDRVDETLESESPSAG